MAGRSIEGSVGRNEGGGWLLGRCRNERTNERTNARKDGRTDGRKDGRTDELTNERILMTHSLRDQVSKLKQKSPFLRLEMAGNAHL